MNIEVNTLPNINTIIKHKKKALPVSNHPHLHFILYIPVLLKKTRAKHILYVILLNYMKNTVSKAE